MDAISDKADGLVPFKSPKKFLVGLDPSVTATLIASAADIVLVLDDGTIEDVALGNAALSSEGFAKIWRGKHWADTVTPESRHKIDELIKVERSPRSVWRQVNHPGASGAVLPVKYTTIKTGRKGQCVAIGRDLRSLSALQQRLVEAHQDLERDYDRLRSAETQFRMLFQSVSEGILIIDGDSNNIIDANPAAETMLAKSTPVGETLLDQFPKKYGKPIEQAIASAISNGVSTTDPVRHRRGTAWRLSISPFRLRDRIHLIVRLLSEDCRPATRSAEQEILRLVETMPDGMVVTNQDHFILAANTAFARMAGFVNARPPEGKSIGEYLGRSTTDLNVLTAALKQHGSVRNFATVIRDRYGAEEQVEVSAAIAPAQNGDIFGFSIRLTARRLEVESRIGEELPRSVEQVTGLVGKVPLKEIIRESTDLIERLCVEAALEITDDNRASAAEILGLSRQGLYSKLKRFGIDD